MSGTDAETAAPLLAKPKALALLAYIAIARPRGYRRRDEILALLWPDSATEQARNALRQSLFLLRSHLPPGTLVSRGAEEIAIDASKLAIDVRDFEDQADAGQGGAALAEYEGALLDGFRLYANSDFDAWLMVERARLHSRAVRTAMQLAARSIADGDADARVRWIAQALELSPHDEDVLREAMALLQRAGDERGAQSLFADAALRFRNDLDIALSPETERMGRALIEQRPSPAGRALPLVDRRVAQTVTGNTPPALLRPRIVTPDARRSYLEARQFASQRSPVTIMKAVACYERALELSPDYAEAHSGLGVALCQAVVYLAYPGSAAWPRAKAHASHAMRLDASLGEAHAVLAHVTLCYDYDWAAAETLYRKALELDPSAIVSRQFYALYYLTALGRTDDALAVLDRARDDMPDNPGTSVYYGMICTFGRLFERALLEADFVLQGQPGHVQAHWVRGMALEGLGKNGDAIEAFETGVTLTGRSSLMLSQLGRAYASAGEGARATAVLGELDARGENSGPAAYYSAEILAALGDEEGALDRLYSEYRQRNPCMVFVGVRYALDTLRGTRRFRDLLMRIGLPAYERTRSARP